MQQRLIAFGLFFIASVALVQCGYKDIGDMSGTSQCCSPDGSPFPRSTKILWNVTPVKQATNYTCGASAMQSVLAYYGHGFTEEFLAKELGSDAESGTDHVKMAAYANRLGIKAEVKTNLKIEDLKPYLDRDQPVIVEAQAYGMKDGVEVPNMDYTNVWDQGHYMVAIGLDQNNIYFMDPSASGSRGFLPLKDFVPRWHDLDWKNQQLTHTAIFFDGKPNPVALPRHWVKIP